MLVSATSTIYGKRKKNVQFLFCIIYSAVFSPSDIIYSDAANHVKGQEVCVALRSPLQAMFSHALASETLIL